LSSLTSHLNQISILFKFKLDVCCIFFFTYCFWQSKFKKRYTQHLIDLNLLTTFQSFLHFCIPFWLNLMIKIPKYLHCNNLSRVSLTVKTWNMWFHILHTGLGCLNPLSTICQLYCGGTTSFLLKIKELCEGQFKILWIMGILTSLFNNTYMHDSCGGYFYWLKQDLSIVRKPMIVIKSLTNFITVYYCRVLLSTLHMLIGLHIIL
jgi:hypothetical protein